LLPFIGVVSSIISHLKGSGTQSDYKADSPAMDHSPLPGLSELILKNEDGPSRLSPYPQGRTVCFPLQDREAKLSDTEQAH